MARLDLARVYLHEWVFGGFTALMALRLAWTLGPASRLALTWEATVAGLAGAVALGMARGDVLGLRLRLLAMPLAMNVLFASLGAAIPALGLVRRDAWLQHADGVLVGTTPGLLLQPLVRPWLTELLSGCYLLFFPYLAVSLLWYLAADPTTARRFYTGMFLVYGLGFLGYTLVPAGGPYLAMKDAFHVPLDGFVLTRWNDAVVAKGSNGYDVFPSLHCAASTFMLGFDFLHRKWRFRAYLLPCVGLWISTLYLRYHYLTDVLAGFTLAAACLLVAERTPAWAAEKDGA